MEIQKQEITKELQESYLDYAMSVIVSRALPDVRDGLKPVQRRILWAMWDAGLSSQAKLRKSATVVGDVMGKYHPHGDSSIYDTMVRMAQTFSLRYPLIHGQGNWGSVDGDNAAAMRYCVTADALIATESGLQSIGTMSQSGDEDIDIRVLSKDKKISTATKWFDSGEHETLKIKTDRGYAIQGTKNHPLLIWDKGAQGEPRMQWKLLEDIKIGDVAVIDRSSQMLWPEKEIDLTAISETIVLRPRMQKKILPSTFTADLAFVLGAITAEGSVTEHKIEFCNSDPAFIEAFEKSWKNVFPDCRLHRFERQPSSYGKKPYSRLEIHSRHVIAFLREVGLLTVKSREKRIPHLILQSPRSVAASFLKAYFEGDGSISASGRMIELSACSVSEALLSEMQTLMLRFGIVSTFRRDEWRSIYKLYIRGKSNYLLFQEEIGFFSRRKIEKLEQVISSLTHEREQSDTIPYLADFIRSFPKEGSGDRQFVLKNNFDRYSGLALNNERVTVALRKENVDCSPLFSYLLEQHYLFDPITTIEDGGVQKVYSLRVDSECHSFVANGFINHNTECKLTKLAAELLTDIEKETVDWQPNYDGSREEPMLLPAKLPNLLLNGTMGIAVGMATSIPPHHLGEIVDATLSMIDNPKSTSEDLLEFVKGPDFPTGGIMFDKKAIAEVYKTGRGPITVRGVVEIVDRPKGKNQFDIVISEIPYQVNKSELIIKFAELITEKRIEGIRDIRDESDREGMRIVIEIKNEAAPQKILNQLYQLTDLQKDFHTNMVALTEVLDPNDSTGQTKGLRPATMSLRDIISSHIAHRENVVRRRAQFDLKKAEEREHILLGLVKALSDIDRVIATIRKSADRADAFKNLIAKFDFSEIQTNAILEMRLQTLAALERERLEEELKEKQRLIADLKALLKSPAKILAVIKDELRDLKDEYNDERRTKLVAHGLKDFNEEDLIPNEEAVVTLSASGFIKRLPPGTFHVQKRGGKGLIGSDVGDEDFLTHILSLNTHDRVLFFTDRGRVFQTRAYEIPAASRTAKGKPIMSFLEIPADEKVTAVVAVASQLKKKGKVVDSTPVSAHTGEFLVMITEGGVVKRISLSEFENVRRTGIIAIGLDKGDLLRWVKLSSGKDEVVITTSFGQSIRFKESDLRAMGRGAAGVWGIRLKKGDRVAGADVVHKENPAAGIAKLLVVMANGYGKLTPLKEYKVQKRGGSGIKTAAITKKTGALVAARVVTDEEELIALSTKGQVIRAPIKGVRTAGRATQGVRIMNVDAGDSVAGVVCL